MLLNIALILYVAVCLYLCLRNKKALYRFQGALLNKSDFG